MNGGLHHLIRRKSVEPVEEFPHPAPAKRFLDYLMYGVALVAPLVLLPQVATLYTLKDAAGLSLTTWCLLGVINVLWVIYASAHKERPLMISSFLMGTLDVVIAIGIVMYR